MQPRDIEKIVTLSRPALTSDGQVTVVAASRPNIRANRQLSQLWAVDVATGERLLLTRGFADRAPKITPDDRAVLFLREVDGAAQVFALPISGGEPTQVTYTPHGVADFQISPCGKRLALQVRVPAQGRGKSVKDLTPEAQSPRHITTLRYLGNGVGYVDDHVAHIAVLDIDLDALFSRLPEPTDAAARPDGEVEEAPKRDESRQLTEGPVPFRLLRWEREGILAATNDHEERDLDLRASLVRISRDGEQHRLVPADAGYSFVDAATVDGQLWFLGVHLGEQGRDFVGRATTLFRWDGTSAAPLTDPSYDFGDPGSHLVPAPNGVLAFRRNRGRVQLVRVTADEVAELTSGDVCVTGVAATGQTVVAVAALEDSYGELGEVTGGEFVTRTDFGRELQDAGLVRMQEHDIPARDGHTVHGWVAIPEGEGPHPVLLNIHGGPFAQYSIAAFDELQVAVAAGYAVVQCNPRGSAGYGEKHARAIKEGMGTVDYTDVLDFLDGVLDAHPELDRERLGIMGGSYGGYLTAWTIAHDHRFTAAIVERGFLDPETFIGTSDIGTYFTEEYAGYDPEHARTQSPMAFADRVQTPTLVIHSELDFRCPLEQAQRYYTKLKRNGVETELLIFPGEDHELTRSGSPRHRVERFEHVMRWWQEHLPVASQ